MRTSLICKSVKQLRTSLIAGCANPLELEPFAAAPPPPISLVD